LIQQYAAHHMATEHHIDSFDAASFFNLHDLNRDGFLDTDEIEAIYGVHHAVSQKNSKDEEEHSQMAQTIVNTVRGKMDTNGDGKISLEEFVEHGLDALPNFSNLRDVRHLGHHYDPESEFFLHHEDMHHATPETQTDDSYNHPEDLEHFQQHESIEAEENRRERKFTGLSEEELAQMQHQHDQASPDDSSLDKQPDSSETPVSNQTVPGAEDLSGQQILAASKPKFTREVPPEEQEPAERYADALKERENQPEWGKGKEGYKRPKTPADKMRRNLPYKYKFRRNWGDF